MWICTHEIMEDCPTEVRSLRPLVPQVLDPFIRLGLLGDSEVVDSESRRFQGKRGLDLAGVAKARVARGGALLGRSLVGAGPGAEQSLLVKRRLPSPKRRERQAACPPARPGEDWRALGSGSWVRDKLEGKRLGSRGLSARA